MQSSSENDIAIEKLAPEKQAEIMGQFQTRMQNPANVDKLPAPMKLVREQAPDRAGLAANRKDDKTRNR